MIGNIIGSNMFNFTILSVADLLSWKESIYIGSSQTNLMLIFGVAASAATAVILLLKRPKKEERYPRPWIYLVLSVIVVLCYLEMCIRDSSSRYGPSWFIISLIASLHSDISVRRRDGIP